MPCLTDQLTLGIFFVDFKNYPVYMKGFHKPRNKDPGSFTKQDFMVHVRGVLYVAVSEIWFTYNQR